MSWDNPIREELDAIEVENWTQADIDELKVGFAELEASRREVVAAIARRLFDEHPPSAEEPA